MTLYFLCILCNSKVADAIPLLIYLKQTDKRFNFSHEAGFVSEGLRKRGIDTILVGGACVTISN